MSNVQLQAVVEEYAHNYSWHIQETKCHMTLKSEDLKKAEFNTTGMAQGLCRRETEKVQSLRSELT
jgi:hypothetical protein